MKKLFIGVVIGFFAACTSQAIADDDPTFYNNKTGRAAAVQPDWSYHAVKTPYGTVDCIYAGEYRSGGPSCNWNKFNDANKD